MNTEGARMHGQRLIVMSVDVLVVGDVHIKLDNLDDIMVLIDRLEQVITEKHPAVLVLLGDVLHTHERIHTACLNTAENLFRRMSAMVPTYVLVGNHDYISNSQFLTDQHWMTPFKRWHNLTIVDRVTPWELNGIRFVACPYVPDGRLVEALNTVPSWQSAHMLFAHQTLDGVKMGAVLAENVEAWEATYPYLCSGHIHDKQTVADNLYYTGTPMQHAFGESHHKSVVLFTVYPDRIQKQELELKVSVKRIEYITVAQAYTFAPTIGSHETVRLTIKGKREECVVFKKTAAFKQLCAMAKVVFDEMDGETVETIEDASHTFQDVLYESLQDDYFLTKWYKHYAQLPHHAEVVLM